MDFFGWRVAGFGCVFCFFLTRPTIPILHTPPQLRSNTNLTHKYCTSTHGVSLNAQSSSFWCVQFERWRGGEGLYRGDGSAFVRGGPTRAWARTTCAVISVQSQKHTTQLLPQKTRNDECRERIRTIIERTLTGKARMVSGTSQARVACATRVTSR